jgi:hypothetical protein
MRKYMIPTMTVITTLAIASLVGCGGGGSGGTSTKTGYFIDSAVEGLEYTSGTTTGITGADGSFKYEEGKPVTFKIGSMVLGSVTVTNNRVFPVDLVSGATDENHQNVSLMAQILQSLDSDGDASNGITIAGSTRQAINQTLNIATSDPASITSSINQLINSATSGRVNTLINDADAKGHLQTNLLREYLGTWTGSYSGNDNGTCDITIRMYTARAGATIEGSCISNLITPQQGGVGAIDAQFPSSGVFRGNLTNGAQFNGDFTRKGTMSGTWINGGYSGTWTLTKQPSSN